MTEPTDPLAPAPQQTALTDEENVMWVPVEDDKELNEVDAYWRARGMTPPARVTTEE